MGIKGINTAPIKQNDRFFLMAFKIRDNNDNDRMFLMQLTTLIDFLIILRARVSKVAQRLGVQGEDYKEKCIAANESLARNIPQITQEEVLQIDPGNMVMSIAPKLAEAHFTLVSILHNEQVITIEIDDSQAEFIIMAIRQAVTLMDDQETLQTLGALLDFIMMYNVDLSNMDNLQYQEINHEPWKKDLFTEYLAVLFSFDTEEGKKLLSGVILKTNEHVSSPETESIVQRVAMLTPAIKVLQEKYKNCQTFRRSIPSGQTPNLLTKDECLRALHNFCLETKPSLV